MLGALTEDEWRQRDAELEERLAAAQRAELAERWRRVTAAMGRAYANCRLSNFKTPRPEQRAVLDRLRRYAAEMPRLLDRGAGIVLYGPTGTGKDHLLLGLAYEAIYTHGLSVAALTGAELFRLCGDAIANHAARASVLAPYQNAKILILSDPVPPGVALRDWRAEVMYDLVQTRVANLRPIWCSMNAWDNKDADERLTPPIWDRLRYKALLLRCSWPSWRKPASAGNGAAEGVAGEPTPSGDAMPPTSRGSAAVVRKDGEAQSWLFQ